VAETGPLGPGSDVPPSFFVAPASVGNADPVALTDVFATTADTPLDVVAPGLLANDLDPEGDAIVVTAFTPPSNGRLTAIVTTGRFTYEPDPGFVGTDQFTYRIRDASGNISDFATVTVEVLPEFDRAPIGLPDFYATLEGAPLDVAAPGLRINDLDPDGNAVVLSSFTSPSNGRITAIVTTGRFAYEPDPGFTGTDMFTYRLRDTVSGIRSDEVTVTIEVLPSGSADPVAVQDAFATTVDVPLEVASPGLIANDLDPDGDAIVVTSFTNPSNGTLTAIVTSGRFSYQPDPGFIGTDEFTYRIRDAAGNLSEFMTATIEVLPDPNRPPIGMPDHYGTLADETLAVAAPGLLANDVDPDGDMTVVASFDQPSNGQLTAIVTSGRFAYVPDPGFTGTDMFTYRLRDVHGNVSDPVTVTIDVLAPQDVTPPEISVVDPVLLWPPNHKYRSFRVQDLVTGVFDEGDPALSVDEVLIARVWSDEREDGSSDGRTVDDIVIASTCQAVDVRAERRGTGNGRVYVVELAVTDAAGNTGTASVLLNVPRERKGVAVLDAAASVVECGM
jgi:hypothetical protein